MARHGDIEERKVGDPAKEHEEKGDLANVGPSRQDELRPSEQDDVRPS